MELKKCEVCGTEIKKDKFVSRARYAERRYCCYKCRTIAFRRGDIGWFNSQNDLTAFSDKAEKEFGAKPKYTQY
jgi:hypothetical protein